MLRLVSLLLIVGVAVHALPSYGKSPSIDGRIVGGHPTDISKHPWQVSLQLLNNPFCGGSLISKQWVLTAAHCVDNTSRQRLISVRVGSTHSNNGGEIIRAAQVVLHPGWNFQHTKQYDNDIALVKLTSPVTSSSAQQIALPSASSSIPDGADIVITGWGATRENGSASSTLLEVTVPYVPISKCGELYASSPYHISKNMFCAGLVGVGGKDACQGDSGGPAVYNNKELVGVVSWGIGCARANFPGVYARVTEYLTWINSHIS